VFSILKRVSEQAVAARKWLF